MTLQIIEIIPGIKKAVEATVNPGEDVLILGSTDINPMAYEAIAGVCTSMGCEVTLALSSPRLRMQDEPTQMMAKAMLGAQVVLQCLSTSLAHTTASTEAGLAGVRIVSMYLQKGQELRILKSFQDVDVLETRRYTISGNNLINEAMKKGNDLHMTSPLGMDFRCRLLKGFEPDEWYTHYGIMVGPHRQYKTGFTAWPPSTLHPYIEEDSAEGVFVADKSIDVIGALSEPVKLYFKQGEVIKVEGGIDAVNLDSLLASMDHNSRKFGLFGIGSSKFIPTTGFWGEHRRKSGAVVIGMGKNNTYPYFVPRLNRIIGTIESKMHWDAVASNPTCTIAGIETVINGNPCWE